MSNWLSSNNNNNNNNKTKFTLFSEWLAGPCRSRLSKPLADFCVFEELLHLLTLPKVQTDHNGPQVNPTMSDFKLNNNNKLINEAGSLCSSDSVEEENEIEEQSGQPIKCQIPQSQWGTAKTVLVENNLSTASFPFRFFIQLSSQPVHMLCDFPFVYRKLR